MSDLSSHLSEFRTALVDGDFARARGAYQHLADASLEELLDQLATALENEKYDDVKTIIGQIEQRYEDRQPEEQTLAAQIEAYKSQPAAEVDLGAIQQLTDFLGTASQTSLQRSKLFMQVAAVIDAHERSGDQPEAPDPGTVATTATKTKQQEQTNDQAASSAESTISSETLPPSLSFITLSTSTQAPSVGTPLTIDSTIKNVGESQVTGVELSVSVPSGVTTNKETVSLGSLSGGSTVTESVTVTGQSEGTYTIQFEVTGSEDTQARQTETVSVTAESSAPPPVVGNQPPTDPDGDGLYEDVNGDGTFDEVDVQALFVHLYDDAIQNNVSAFDYNGDGKVDEVDVQALFSELG